MYAAIIDSTDAINVGKLSPRPSNWEISRTYLRGGKAPTSAIGGGRGAVGGRAAAGGTAGEDATGAVGPVGGTTGGGDGLRVEGVDDAVDFRGLYFFLRMSSGFETKSDGITALGP